MNKNNMDLRERLNGRLSKNDVCELAKQMREDDMKEELYRLTRDREDRVARQAMWVFRQMDDMDNEWLWRKHDELIDRVIMEGDVAKRRLMLSLLMRQPMEKESLRSDFLDFCLGNITACSQPYAIRAYCIKLAYEQCKSFPELLEELKNVLDMLKQEKLSPGLESAMRQITKKLSRHRKREF